MTWWKGPRPLLQWMIFTLIRITSLVPWMYLILNALACTHTAQMQCASNMCTHLDNHNIVYTMSCTCNHNLVFLCNFQTETDNNNYNNKINYSVRLICTSIHIILFLFHNKLVYIPSIATGNVCTVRT